MPENTIKTGFAFLLLFALVLVFAGTAYAFCINDNECSAVKCFGNVEKSICNRDTGSCYCGPATCGNLSCNGNESFSSCPSDCSVGCGNNICDATENAKFCPSDCTAVCGNSLCEAGESPINCATDCAALTSCCEYETDAYSGLSRCVVYCAICGDGHCDASRGEDSLTCQYDCGLSGCGDGVCGTKEDALNCPQDCPIAELQCNVDAHCKKLPNCDYGADEKKAYMLAEGAVFNACGCISGKCEITVRARGTCGDGFCSIEEKCDPSFSNFCKKDCGTCRLPDLVAAGFEVPAIIEAGEIVGLVAVIENRGSNEAGLFSVSLAEGGKDGVILAKDEINGLFLTPTSNPEQSSARFQEIAQVGVVPLEVEFNLKADEDTEVNRYDVDFDGDGFNDISFKPPASVVLHTYKKPGFYLADATVTYADGKTDTESTNITALAQPLRHEFTLDTTGLCGEIALHVYVDSDNLLEEADKENNDLLGYINIKCPILPVAVVSIMQDGRAIGIDASESYDTNGTIVNYIWDFGNGIIEESAASAITHTYAGDGNFSVKLTVVNERGLKGVAAERIVVGSPPIAEFNQSMERGIVPLDISVNASQSVDSDGTIVSYLWDFGEGTNAKGMNAEHNYASPGTYPVLLEVVDNAGLVGHARGDVTVFGSERPDLLAEVQALPETAGKREEVGLDLVIMNVGGGDASGFDVVLRAEAADGKELTRQDFSGMRSAESATVNFRFVTGEDLGESKYFIVIDPADNIREANKRNNTMPLSVKIVLPEICGNGIDDDVDGIVDELCEEGVAVELCINNIDDDNDGIVDEGCEWTNAVLEGIPLNIHTGGEAVAGEQVIIEVTHPNFGPVEGVSLKVVSPSGEEIRLQTDDRGRVSMVVNESGTYSLMASKYTLSSEDELKVVNVGTVAERVAFSLPVMLFGQFAEDAPLMFFLLLVMCVLAGVLVFEKVNSLFLEQGYAPTEERRKKAMQYALAAVAIILPLLVNKAFGFWFGLGIAVVEVGAMAIIIYTTKKVERPWESEAEEETGG